MFQFLWNTKKTKKIINIKVAGIKIYAWEELDKRQMGGGLTLFELIEDQIPKPILN